MNHPEVTKLYKYRPDSPRALEMLERSELYFCASNRFNDPFDCRGRRDFEFSDNDDLIQKFTPLEANHQGISVNEAAEYLRQVVASEETTTEYLATKSGLFQRMVLQLFGIYCLSEIPTDILMWSHYADGHNGFCLEFTRAVNNFLCYARPVQYPDDDGFPFVDYWKQEPAEQIEESAKIVLTKAKHWAYEREWRAIDRPADISDSYSGHVVSYPPKVLTGIIFGVSMPQERRDTLRELLDGRPIRLFEARPVKNRFQIELADLP